MDPLLIALATAAAAIGGTAASRFIDAWFARRAHIGPLVAETDAARRELIETLEQTAKARADRINTLETELAEERRQRSESEAGFNLRIQRLESALGLCLDRLTETGQSLPDFD